MKFAALENTSTNVYHDENYRLVEGYGVVFSYAQKGRAMTAHFAANKKSLRKLKPAINAFCDFIFEYYPWCNMIFAAIDRERESIMRLVKKCGFEYLADDSKHSIYVRVR